MTSKIVIREARPEDMPTIAQMAGALMTEIMDAIGTRAFHFDLDETRERLTALVAQGKYQVFVAHRAEGGGAIGFVALCETWSLYAEGAFGIIPEFYVHPQHRGLGAGSRLADAARAYGSARGWTRLEVTTPPLPPFEATLRFYERMGFAITGGRKLKLGL
ncbi:MAG: GNAT family N-acetyltransferase [Chromatiales bacterium 21-64-14]|nr:MAG: GNAT family N-acetyltransferase [Chromatiales bacterium 21-64-14]HQU15675.1 GNAT family N-acetyltransferase [Gammaproteobacteria bacterium]